MKQERKFGYGYYLKHINCLFKDLVDLNLKKYNLTRSQEDILHFLYDHRNETIIQKDIEEFFHISNPTVSGLLNRLEQKGYIQRIPSKKDKRIKIIQPTDEIVKHHQEIKFSIHCIENQMVKDFSEEEKELFFTLLEKAKINLKNESEHV